MTKIKAAGYMIQDKQGNAIFGVGETVEEAWQQVVSDAGPFFDAFGNEKAEEDAFIQDFKAYGATAALIAKVQSEGGAIAWEVVEGVGCTREEAEADAIAAEADAIAAEADAIAAEADAIAADWQKLIGAYLAATTEEEVREAYETMLYHSNADDDAMVDAVDNMLNQQGHPSLSDRLYQIAMAEVSA